LRPGPSSRSREAAATEGAAVRAPVAPYDPVVTVFIGSRVARALPWLRLAALLPITLLAGHQAVFTLQFGLGDGIRTAMTAGGHDGYWSAFSLVILALTAALLAREGVRVVHLRLQLRGRAASVATGSRPGEAPGSWRREFRSTWPLLFAATAIAFGIQENLEHIAAGEAPHGLGVLIGGEHPFAVPVLAAVSAAIAAVASLVRWRVRILELGVARVRQRPRVPRPRATLPAREWPAVGSIRAHAWFLVRLLAGRAPPLVA
jgi:hypothetical protein